MKYVGWALKGTTGVMKGRYKCALVYQSWQLILPEVFRTRKQALAFLRDTDNHYKFIPVKVNLEIKDSYE